MRVAIIEPVGGHGGMDYYDFALCEGLMKAGVEAVLYTSDETEAMPGSSIQMKRVYRGIYGNESIFTRGVRYVSGSIRALIDCVGRGTRICHFHFFHVGPLEFFNIALGKVLRRRVVITVHDVEALAEGLDIPLFHRVVYRMADKVIAHNRLSRNELRHRLGIPEDKIAIIPQGNYLDLVKVVPDKEEARRRLLLPISAKILLFFGHIKHAKGLDLLLESFAAIASRFPETRLLIAGRPWKLDFTEYERKIDELGIRDLCTIRIGYVPNEQVQWYYGAADLVVLPYRKIYQSAVLLMTMSYGRAVLASDLEGMKEIITDGETGFLFPTGDSSGLAERLGDLLSDLSRIGDVAAKGREHAARHYNWDMIGQKTKSTYERSISH